MCLKTFTLVQTFKDREQSHDIHLFIYVNLLNMLKTYKHKVKLKINKKEKRDPQQHTV